MKLYGLLGYPLEHSYSKGYFTDKFKQEGIDAKYLNIQIDDLNKLPEFLIANGPFNGLNVTYPYKEKILGFLDMLDSTAEEIGSVNLISIKDDGFGIKLKGFNTDSIGFTESLKIHNIQVPRKALILGTGGASKSVAFALNSLGSITTLVSRSISGGDILYSDLDRVGISDFELIVNTTPLGMFPLVEGSPDIPYSLLSKSSILYDLVYNPAETTFMKRGIEIGCKVFNGLAMLHLQAEAGWRIWQSETSI
jgi:shikimate dehydrogenase